jgi:predicted ATPase/DNA-binding Xre family transcriptional regulator
MAGTEAFGALLLRLRRARGWTQAQLAERAGLAESTIANLERGRSKTPRADGLPLLIKALELDDAEREAFLAAAGSEPPEPPRPLVPPTHTALIGRDEELPPLLRQLRANTPQRLLTLVGPGGCGKTRLALALAERQAGRVRDGVRFVDLTTVADHYSVVGAVAHALEIRAQVHDAQDDEAALLAAIVAWINRRRILLVLDNCEHLRAACAALVARLLADCRELRILATSREPLGVRGERCWWVQPLATPPATQRPTVEAVLASAAVQLFVARARDVAPQFLVTASNAAALAQVCRHLEGLPLALELVAARLVTLTIEQIAGLLDRQVVLSAAGPSDAPARHQTLRAAIDWSHDLLDDAERALWRRLAVFAGGFALASAERVCAAPPLGPERLLAALDSLVQRSLVAVEPGEGGANRYRLLEPLRLYAAERLAASGEERAVRAAHAAWCLTICERIEDPLDGGPEVRLWLADLDREYANLRGALAWAAGHDTGVGLGLTAASWPYFYLRGDHAVGRQLLRRALAVAAPLHVRARLLFGLGRLDLFDAVAAARAALAEALTIAREFGDERLCAGIHWSLAFLALVARAGEAVREHLASGSALAEARGTPGLCERYRILRGYIALAQGDLVGGRGILMEAHAAALAGDRPQHLCLILTRLSAANLRLGHADDACANAEAMRLAAIDLGSLGYQTIANQRLGLAQEWRGDFGAAERAYREALALNDEAGGNRLWRASGLIGLGRVALLRGDNPAALAWLQQAAVLVAQLGHRQLRRDLTYPLGLALWHTGQRSLARVELSQALALQASGDDAALLAGCLEGVAALAVAEGAAERAARWLGAMGALRARARTPRPGRETAVYQATRDAATAALGEARFARAADCGAARAMEEVIADARAWLSV